MKKPDFLKFLAGCLFIMAVVMLGACCEEAPLADEPVEEPKQPSEEPIEPEPEEEFSPYFEECDSRINKAVNNFSMDVFREIINSDLSTRFPNPAISPLSITFALSMAANSFDNQFASEVLSKFLSDDLSQLNMYFRRLMAGMPEGGNVKLANSVWYYDGHIKPSAAYCSNIAKAYTAPVNPIDFSNTQQAAKLINGWVADHTDNLIDQIIEPGDLESGVVALANALTFDGKWAYEFDDKLTKKEVFHGATSDAEIDYLHIKKLFGYRETPLFKSVSLPLDEFGYYDLVVFLPNDGETIASVIADIDIAEVSKIDALTSIGNVDLSIPKFSSELNDKCTELIKAVGIDLHKPHTLDGFSGGKYISLDYQVSELNHAAKMSINEKGALAASATVITSVSGGIPQKLPFVPKEVELKIDRPFFYLLRYTRENNILIAGCFTQP